MIKRKKEKKEKKKKKKEEGRYICNQIPSIVNRAISKAVLVVLSDAEDLVLQVTLYWLLHPVLTSAEDDVI